ncbi:MAG TPA: class I SAM-dependent methyltransferase [Pyrinomonadaceae bacterium]|nr:class I SAM-dependent methyltransferase [Pyrinomonadaceae bacterium]
MTTIDKNLVGSYWSNLDCSASDKNFYSFPPLRSRACKLIFGEFDASRRDWSVYWTVEKYLKGRIPFQDALSICCGFGEVERSMAKLGVADSITGIDIAPGAIKEATNRAGAEGLANIRYDVGDIGSIELGHEKYDLIWANGALHHIEKLEKVISSLYQALKPKGILVANEYIGPRYQQVGKRQAEIINAVKHLLPPELRSPISIPRDTSLKAKLKTTLKTKFKNRFFQDYLVGEDKNSFGKIWNNTPIEWFLNNDPSESIRGDEIVPILSETFDEIEVKAFHGPVLFYALDEKFFDNFDLGNSKHRKILEALFQLEDSLIEMGELKNENAHIVCWKS